MTVEEYLEKEGEKAPRMYPNEPRVLKVTCSAPSYRSLTLADLYPKIFERLTALEAEIAALKVNKQDKITLYPQIPYYPYQEPYKGPSWLSPAFPHVTYTSTKETTIG